MTDLDHFADQLAFSVSEQKALPPFPEGLTLQEAYGLQARLVDKVSLNGVAGLKAGLTNSQGQQLFGIEHALLGHLYAVGRLEPGAEITHKPKLAIECEIGIVVDARGKPKSLGPAIEIVYLDFERTEDMTAVNLAAANLGADRFIQGTQQDWGGDFSNTTVTLMRDGEHVTQAPITEALGGPEPALAWMRGEAERLGIQLQDGMLLMTGSCGGIIPSAPGSYVADYGPLGSIAFDIVAPN